MKLFYIVMILLPLILVNYIDTQKEIGFLFVVTCYLLTIILMLSDIIEGNIEGKKR